MVYRLWKELIGIIISLMLIFLLFFFLYPGEPLNYLKDKINWIKNRIIKYINQFAQSTVYVLLNQLKEIIGRINYQKIWQMITNFLKKLTQDSTPPTINSLIN